MGICLSDLNMQVKAIEKGRADLLPKTHPEWLSTPGCTGMDNGSNNRRAAKKRGTLIRGQLNPAWIEWLMGWPIGWTEQKPLETDKFQSWLCLHGTFSQQDFSTMTDTSLEPLLAFDTETHLIAEANIAPPIVCCSLYDGSDALLAGKADPDNALADVVQYVIDYDGVAVAHNLAFDLAVFCSNYPDQIPAIFQGLIAGKYQDTLIREKLLVLAETGDLEYLELPNGAKKKLSFSLAGLVLDYFQVDISEGKTGDDAWRTNYKVLEDIPTDKWPQDAVDYAKEDSVWCHKVYFAQEERRQELIDRIGVDPFGEDGTLAAFRAAISFSLFMVSTRGMKINHEEKAEIEAMLAAELSPEKLNLLTKRGILIPAEPPQPYKNGAVDKETGEPKMTKGQKEKINKNGAWIPYCLEVARHHEWDVPYTDPTDKFPDGQPSIKMDWLEDHEGADATLDQYLHRQRLQKLVTTEIPRMNREDGTDADVVHPMFDGLKETGRSSSYASKGWPSFNGQNVDPRARPCFEARPGFVLVSIDYNQMELGTAAQTCLDKFGYSVMADKINAGVDLHAYLGAQIAATTDYHFIRALHDSGVSQDDAEAVHELFLACKDADDDEVLAFFKKYRTFAKPTGLGYPGGLGPDTFVAYAKATYGVEIDKETATALRDVWRRTFPEMVDYHNSVNKHGVDEENSQGSEKRYAYTTPMGMYRAGCFYCAAANGEALQSPSAEGALAALVNVVQACYDVTRPEAEILNGHVYPVNFIHDEILLEVREDALLTQRVDILKGIMIEWMEAITPDVKAGVEATAMRRWHKAAQPVFDENNNLLPWEPE